MKIYIRILLIILVFAGTMETPEAKGLETFNITSPILININNFKSYHEFRFKDGSIEKLQKGNVLRTNENGKEKLIFRSDEYYSDYLEKSEKRKLTIDKYSDVFSLHSNSLAEISTDGKLIIYTNDKQHAFDNTLNIASLSDNKNLFNISVPEGRTIQDTAWIRESNLIAILSKSTHIGLLPWELIAAVAGRPVPYMSYYLEIYTSQGEKIYEQRILKDIKYGNGSIIANAGK